MNQGQVRLVKLKDDSRALSPNEMPLPAVWCLQYGTDKEREGHRARTGWRRLCWWVLADGTCREARGPALILRIRQVAGYRLYYSASRMVSVGGSVMTSLKVCFRFPYSVSGRHQTS